MASKEFEKFLSSLPKEQQTELQKAQELGKDVSKGTDLKSADMEADKAATYKEQTGRELDKNVYGYDKTETATKPITEEIGNKAKEAATQGNSTTFNEVTSKPTTATTPKPTETDKLTQ